MALIKHLASGETHRLSSSHLVGRGQSSLLRLDNPKVSGEHAAFRWTGSNWVVRDLSSRNGTFVDDRRLSAGDPIPVRLGSRIAFGDVNDVFEIVDDEPPAAVARSEDGESQLAEDGMLILPDLETPEYTVFEDSPGRWFVESSDGQRRPVQDRERLHSGGRWWELDIPLVVEKTQQAGARQPRIGDVGLRFSVSIDEEHVELSLLRDGEAITMPTRSYDYLLLTLARARLRDEQDVQLPESEHGWVYIPELIKQLETNDNHFNVALYRARRQVAAAKIGSATELFERRPNARQIRLGLRHVEVVSL